MLAKFARTNSGSENVFEINSVRWECIWAICKRRHLADIFIFSYGFSTKRANENGLNQRTREKKAAAPCAGKQRQKRVQSISPRLIIRR